MPVFVSGDHTLVFLINHDFVGLRTAFYFFLLEFEDVRDFCLRGLMIIGGVILGGGQNLLFICQK